MFRLAVLVALLGCREQPRDAPPPPAAKVAVPATPVEPPLDPVRVDAEKTNRDALARVKQSLQCPAAPPSLFVRYCAAADDFATGNANELAHGDTILVGEVSFIQPGPPSVSTLGTPIPVAFLLRRDGDKISAKQIAFRGKQDTLATLVTRIGKTIDGKWDHVDVPAELGDQIHALPSALLDPFERADGALWPRGLDGMEMRRAKGRWIFVAGPVGPEGRQMLGILVDKHKVLGRQEKSPQTVTVVHM